MDRASFPKNMIAGNGGWGGGRKIKIHVLQFGSAISEVRDL